MQRVSSLLPTWDRRKSNSSTATKSSIERILGTTDSSWDKSRPKMPAQRLSTMSRMACEDFWPATLDKECDRAARILKSMCSDGYLAPLHDNDRSLSRPSSGSEPMTPIQMFQRIPESVIQNAAGIAVFACMRSGLWMTGSGGSGILIARKADGTWSPPSGIMLHTPTLSFIIGVDIYDCVLVINNMAALECLITKPTITLGEDIGLTCGPLVSLDATSDDTKPNHFDDTVLTYVKARGQSRNVNLNGCILTERANENDKFYTSNVSAAQVLAGEVSRQVDETRPLFEVLKAAEGRIDAEASVIARIAAQPAPGDAMIATPRDSPATPTSAFGLPSAEDPDPFGILALEMAGMEIKEAGSKTRPTSRQLDYHTNPTSPTFSKFSRQSMQSVITESNRASYMSSRTDRTKISEAYTHTDVKTSAVTSPSHSEDGVESKLAINTALPEQTQEEIDYTQVDHRPLRHLSGTHSFDGTMLTDSATSNDGNSRTESSVADDAATKASSVYTKDDQDNDEHEVQSRHGDAEKDHDADDEDEFSDSDFDDEEPVIYEVASLQPTARTAMVASPVQVKGSLVTIPKRVAPPLPTRSPARASHTGKSELGDVAHLQQAPSPARTNFTPSPRQSIDETSTSIDKPDVPSIREPGAEEDREPATKADKAERQSTHEQAAEAQPVEEGTEETVSEKGTAAPTVDESNDKSPADIGTTKMTIGAFPSDNDTSTSSSGSGDNTKELVPPSRNPKRQSKPEASMPARDVSPRPVSVS